MLNTKEISGSNGNGQHNLAYMVLANTIGEAMLIETLKMAVFFLHNSSNFSNYTKTMYREAKGCYMFIQGSGLDMALARFGLDYDAQLLRNEFNYCMRRSA